MGYEKQLIKELKKQFVVNYLDNEIILKDIRKSYYAMSKIKKLIFKVIPMLRNYYRNNKLKSKEAIVKNYIDMKYDYIICVNGDGFSDNFYKELFNNQEQAEKIIYLWDDYNWLFKNKHINLFDKKFSFNIDDCKKQKCYYLPMFTKNLGVEEIDKIYDICLIASANDQRISLMKKIYEKYNDKYKFYIYFYSKKDYDFFCYDKPLSDTEYISILSKSKVVIDCYRGNQKGPTTRVYDSIITETKIISTNKLLTKYPVYNENVLIIDDKLIIPENFIYSKYIKTNISSIMLNQWVKHLITKKCD
ncbi:hypothetical protein C1H59_14890, partial [Clostridium sp. 3-3]